MGRRMNRFLYWAPRLLGLTFILFLMMFSLDVFDMGFSPWETIVGLFMHNIPALVLAFFLLIAWKKNEMVGAATFISAGLFYIVIVMKNEQFEWYMLSWLLFITGPALLIGLLFAAAWKLKQKEVKKR